MDLARTASTLRHSPVRWDRVGRVALLLLLVGVLALYVRPAIAYVSALRESHRRQADIARLQADHDRLLARRAALRNPQVIETEARRLGMVRAGERPYVVDGLPGSTPP
jgi:cell division protein FtsB